MTDQPKKNVPPPPPAPSRTSAPSDSALRAAGLAGRPPFKSDPGLLNPETLRHEVKRHGRVIADQEKRIETLEGATDGSANHAGNVSDFLAAQKEATAILFEHLGIEEKLPERMRRSSPPEDDSSPKKKKRAELTTIKDDSWKAKIAGYATAAAIIVKVFYDVLHASGVVK